MSVNPLSVLSDCNAETNGHLFTLCPYSTPVLSGSHIPLTPSWTDWQNGEFTLGSMSNARKHMGWLYIFFGDIFYMARSQ